MFAYGGPLHSHYSSVVGPKFGNKLKQLIPTKSVGSLEATSTSETISPSNSMDLVDAADGITRIEKLIKVWVTI